MHSIGMIQNQLSEVTQFMVSYEPMNPFSGWIRQILLCAMTWSILYCWSRSFQCTAVASMRRTEALASVKFYQILSIFIFFIRLIILEDFIRLISYNGPCVRLGCSFFLATALVIMRCTLRMSTDCTDRTNRNALYPDAIMRCTLRMSSDCTDRQTVTHCALM